MISGHLAVEEGQDQRPDVAAVDVGVAHDDQLVVAQLVDVEVVLADAGAERGDHRLDLVGRQHLVEARLLDVQDLPLERQDGLELPVAPLLGRAAGGIALDQEELGELGVALRAVGELAGEVRGVERALAPRQVARLARRLAGVGRLDADNDGWKDLFIANGHVYSQITSKKLHVSYKEPKVLYRNLGNGRFEDVSAKAGPAIRTENLGRGCAFGDFDNDGDVDVIINNLDGPPTLLRNDGGNRNNWIMFKCVGTRSNRSAIGARVKVATGEHVQIDEVMSGSSYYSQNDFRLHFGLGRAAKADSVEVAWPSGLKERFANLASNQLYVLQETKGILSSRKFGKA